MTTTTSGLSISDFPNELPLELRYKAKGYLLAALHFGFADIYRGDPDALRVQGTVFVTDTHHTEPVPLRAWAYWCMARLAEIGTSA